MTQKTELELLNEAVSSNDIHIVARLIKSYLTKRVGKEFFQFPGAEYYTVSGKTYTGVRFFYGKSSSVRFNWIGKSIGQDTLDSVTVWKDKDDKFEIEFDHNVSIVKVLPFIVPILKNPHTTEFDFVPVDESVNVSIAEKKKEDISEMSMMNTKKASDLIKQHTLEGESLTTHKSQIAERIRRKIGAKHIQILDHDSIRHESEFILKDEQSTVNEEVIRFRRSQADRVKAALKNIPGGVGHSSVGSDHFVTYDKSDYQHVFNALALHNMNPFNNGSDVSQKIRTSNYDAIASTTAAKEKAEQEKKNKEERDKTAKKSEAKKSEKNESEDLDEAKKKIGEYSHGSNVTKVYKLTGEHNEGDPYVVHLHKNGKHYEPADYFTNDEEDAHGTAKHMVQEAAEDLDESTTDEIVINESEELATDIRKYIAKMAIGDKIGYREVKLALGRQHFKLFQVIVETNPHVFDTSGKSPVFIGNPNKIDYARAIETAGGAHVKVTRSTAHEQSLDKTPEEDLEDQATKISYKEKVSHLAGLVKLLKSGATNALFVAGEGGTGKCLVGFTKLDIRETPQHQPNEITGNIK